VVAILFVLAALMMPQAGRFWEAYQLDSATQTLTSNLEFARYTAISHGTAVTVSFYASASYYELFEDLNGNGSREPEEHLMGAYTLPRRVAFSGAGLLGPPASPSGTVTDPISFSDDRLVFNARGKLQNGLGCIYLKNGSNDASAVSFNLAGRMKVYTWDERTRGWR